MYAKINFYKLIFIFFSISSLFFIDSDRNLMELFLKFASITTLLSYYLFSTKRINYLYILVLFFSCLSSSFLIYPSSFLVLGTLFLIAEKFLYIVILRKVASNNFKMLFMFLSIFLIPAIIIYPQLKLYLGKLTYPVLGIAVFSVIMCSFAFANYFAKMIRKNKLLAIGLLLFSLADVLTAYNQFIEYHFFYVIIYTSVYYVARYLVCEAMIVKIANH